MKIQLELLTENANEEIEDFNDFIREENISGLITKLKEAEPEEGAMSAADYLPIIQMVLGSSVVAAGIKGIFDVIKKYFDYKTSTSKIKAEEKKVVLSKKNDKGESESFTMSLLNEEERIKFMKFFED